MTMSQSVDVRPIGPVVESECEIPRDRMWSVEEVSYYLGVPVGPLYSWRVQRRGPASHRLGRFLRYRPEDVDAWFNDLNDWGVAG